VRTTRRRFSGSKVALALLASVPSTAVVSVAGPEPDLAGRIVARLQHDRAEIAHYTYVETAVLEKRGTDGSIRYRTTEVHEVFLQDGRTMKRPLLRDVAQDSEGFSLMRGEESRFLQDLSFRDGRARPAKESPFNIENLVHCFHLDAIGREVLAERPVLKVAFRPIEGCLNQSTRAMRIAAGLSGFLWVDEEGYDVVRVKGTLEHPVSFGFGLLGKVESFDLEADRQRISPEAHILTRFEYRARATSFLFHRFEVLSTRYRSAFARRPADSAEPPGPSSSAHLEPEDPPANPTPRR
jgi:hypothetical protein